MNLPEWTEMDCNQGIAQDLNPYHWALTIFICWVNNVRLLTPKI